MSRLRVSLGALRLPECLSKERKMESGVSECSCDKESLRDKLYTLILTTYMSRYGLNNGYLYEGLQKYLNEGGLKLSWGQYCVLLIYLNDGRCPCLDYERWKPEGVIPHTDPGAFDPHRRAIRGRLFCELCAPFISSQLERNAAFAATWSRERALLESCGFPVCEHHPDETEH